jgi:hypothetical protein
MRLKRSTLSALVSFLLGAGWGIALIGALSMFFSFLSVNFFIALLSAILGAIPGLLMVVFLEYFLLKSEMVSQLKHQTRLLEKMANRQSS